MPNVCKGKFPVCCTVCARVASILNDTVPTTAHLHCMYDNNDNLSETTGLMLLMGYIVHALSRPHNVALGQLNSTWHYDHILRYGLPTLMI